MYADDYTLFGFKRPNVTGSASSVPEHKPIYDNEYRKTFLKRRDPNKRPVS